MLEPNRSAVYGAPLQAAYLDRKAAADVVALLGRCPAYRPTPLVPLPEQARSLGVAEIRVKDESARFALKSFKALGGMHAVLRLAMVLADVSADELLGERMRAAARKMVFACATDGNHGRSVACGAQLLGARAIVYVHHGVSAARVAAIAAYGAEIRTVQGSYDDSVRAVMADCTRNGWTLVSDMSWPGYVEVPRLVMQGYLAMAHEVLAALDAPPTHVFLQAGCGGLAAAVAGHLALVLGSGRPRIVIAEPARAACLFESNRQGRRLEIPPTEPTVMSMLECYEPSLAAWEVLERVADHFLLLAEDEAVAAMRALAFPQGEDAPLVAGESGAAGFAAARAACMRYRAALGITAESRLLVFNTEGATDPDLYRSLIGTGPA
jgi:diaminopropionate ammonia-lyase